MQQPYNADYFLRGKETGVSNYTDYRWQEEPTMALAQRVIEVMGIKPGESFLDFGCARGYLVKALRRLGVQAFGYDISEWAIENCDPEVKGHVSRRLESVSVDHVFSKDTLEHLEPRDAKMAIWQFGELAKKSILIIVPLCAERGGRYLRDEDEFDKTHIARGALDDWHMMATDATMDGAAPWVVRSSYHIPGLKPTSLSHPKSCGFITLRRI